ncbi:hypothetical protein [Bacillus subtilis]|uniref:hypothetical protein n=1 Tax=Bacillus subtilis TaxID=1423 RepID=UPI00397ECE53
MIILKIIGIVVALMLVGFIREVLSLRRLGKDIEFLIQYSSNYVKYCNTYLGKGVGSDEEISLYNRIISDAPKAQGLLLDAGYIDYKPAGSLYYIKNYQVLVNTVQLLRNPLTREDFEMLFNILVMQVSRYNEFFNNKKKGILNPIILLREGVQFFVTLPISLLYWTGLIEYSTQYKLSNNFIVKFLNFLIILIGFISAIFTIVLGWEQFKEFLIKFL